MDIFENLSELELALDLLEDGNLSQEDADALMGYVLEVYDVVQDDVVQDIEGYEDEVTDGYEDEDTEDYEYDEDDEDYDGPE